MDLNKHLFPQGKQHLFRSGINLAIILDTVLIQKFIKL